MSGLSLTDEDAQAYAAIIDDEHRRALIYDAHRRRVIEPCEDCQGAGRIARHVCATDEECKRKCLRVETCMGCLGSGVGQGKG